MKKSLHEVAKTFNLSSADIVLYLSSLGAPIEDCWPEIDNTWLETLKSRYSKYLEVKVAHAIPTLQSKDNISQDAIKLIDKLHRKDLWGNHAVSWDSLRNHLMPNVSNLKEVADDLIHKGYIRATSIHAPLSLNPDRKVEIESLVQHFRQQR